MQEEVARSLEVAWVIFRTFKRYIQSKESVWHMNWRGFCASEMLRELYINISFLHQIVRHVSITTTLNAKKRMWTWPTSQINGIVEYSCLNLKGFGNTLYSEGSEWRAVLWSSKINELLPKNGRNLPLVILLCMFFLNKRWN